MVPDWVSDLGQAGWAAPAADCRLDPSLFRGCLALWDQQLSRACPSHSNSRNTRVCCAHCLVVSDSCDPGDCSPTGSSVRGILQARILERVAISLNGESSRPRDGTCVSCISCLGGGDSLPLSHLGCPQNTHKKHTQVNRNVLGPNTLAKTRFRPQSIGQSKPYSHSQHQWGGNADFALRGTLRHITSGPPAWHLGVNTPILQS